MTKKKKPLDEVKESLDFLGDVDLADVKFDLNQAQDLTGIKKGRIQYWTDSGYIRDLDRVENGRYHYDPEHIRKMLLIEQLYDSDKRNGYTVEGAAKMAEGLLESENDSGAVALLLLFKRQFEDRIDKLADKLVEVGVADQLIEVLGEEEVDGEEKE